MTVHGRGKSFFGQHSAENLLEGHYMAASLPLRKEMAGTMPFAVGIAQLVVIVFTVENSGQT